MMLKKSPWVIDYDCGGCNGCSLEILATLTPRYDIERFGSVYKSSPRNADILIIQGCMNKKAVSRVMTIRRQMAEPAIVMAVGSCAITGGPFAEAYNCAGPVKDFVDVDIFVPGCPPRPEAIIDGMIKALKGLDGRKKRIGKKAKK